MSWSFSLTLSSGVDKRQRNRPFSYSVCVDSTEVLRQSCDDPVTVRIGSANVVNSSEEKLLGVQIDSKLSFDNHVSKLCQKVSNKLYPLTRISP